MLYMFPAHNTPQNQHTADDDYSAGGCSMINSWTFWFPAQHTPIQSINVIREMGSAGWVGGGGVGGGEGGGTQATVRLEWCTWVWMESVKQH